MNVNLSIMLSLTISIILGSLMSNISMPLAVPLSGLTTIPLALCAMNGSGNMGKLYLTNCCVK